MDFQSLYVKQLALCSEIDSVIDLAHKAQSVITDSEIFYRQVALLFHRIDNVEALKDEAMLCSLQMIEEAARQAGVCSTD